MSDKKETYSYRGWLNSDSFIKRGFAVMGYGIMGQIFIMLIALVLVIIFGYLAIFFGYIVGLLR